MRESKGAMSFISVVLTLCLTLTSVPIPAQASGSTTSPFVRQLSIPRSLGSVTHSWTPDPASSHDGRFVVLIQDLHLHYPTQKRILKILNHLYAKRIAGGPVAVEGTHGPYDTSVLAAYPAGPAKEHLVDYLMKKGEVSGDEAFAMLRNENRRLYGVDDSDYYQMNRELYRATQTERYKLLQPLENLSLKLTLLKRDAPSDQLTEAEHSLHYLKRLIRQEATLEDARYVAQRLPFFVAMTEKLLALNKTTNLSSDEIREILKSTVDYYTVALMRDAPLAKNTIALVREYGGQGVSESQPSHYPQTPTPPNAFGVALVVGGFHTAGITRAFEKAGVGYVVVTPHLDEVSPEYRKLYTSRMMGYHEPSSTTAAALGLTISLSESAPFIAEESVRVLMDKPYVASLARWAYPAMGVGLFGLMISAWDKIPGFWDVSAVVSGLKLAGITGIPATVFNPYRTRIAPALRPSPIPVTGVPTKLFDPVDNEFSLMEAETAAAAAAVYRAGLVGLAGKILHHTPFKPGEASQEDVVEFLKQQLANGEGEWDVPHEIRDNIVNHARESTEFNPQKPQKLIIAAIKDVADAEAHHAITAVNGRVYRKSASGLSRWFAASEGLGRDALADGEAFGGGEILNVRTRWASPQGGPHDRLEQAVGLFHQQFTIVDAIEGTNALVGVKEEGLAYKAGDTLPSQVEIVDIAGATSVSLNVHGSHQDLNLLNADDGYAHVMATHIPIERRRVLGSAPLDPDQPEISFRRIREALGGLKPQQIDVLLMNRPREKQKIKWLSEQGYHVSLIPDGTLIPSLFSLMGGRLHPDRHLVVWTTSGAPESRWGQSAEKALSAFGAVGGVRLYPKKMGNAPDWMGKVGITDEELALYNAIKSAPQPKRRKTPHPAIEAFDRQTVTRGSFSYKEIRTYEQLHPEDWQDVVQLKRLYAASEIKGEIDGAVAFVTDNPVFQMPGVRAVGDGQVSIKVLRIRDSKVKIQTIQGDPDALASGDAAIAEMKQRFNAAVHALAEANQVAESMSISFTEVQLARQLHVHPRVAALAMERLVEDKKYSRLPNTGEITYIRRGNSIGLGSVYSPAGGWLGMLLYPASFLEEYGTAALAWMLGFHVTDVKVSRRESFVNIQGLDFEPASFRTVILSLGLPAFWVALAGLTGWQLSTVPSFGTLPVFAIGFVFVESALMSLAHLWGARQPDDTSRPGDLYRVRYALQQRIGLVLWHSVPAPRGHQVFSPVQDETARTKRAGEAAGPVTSSITTKILSSLFVLGVGLNEGASSALAQTERGADLIFQDTDPLLFISALFAGGMLISVLAVILLPVYKDWARRRLIRERDRIYAQPLKTRLNETTFPDVVSADIVKTPSTPSHSLQGLMNRLISSRRRSEVEASMRERSAELLGASA